MGVADMSVSGETCKQGPGHQWSRWLRAAVGLRNLFRLQMKSTLGIGFVVFY